jgi:hypothetical protein
MSRRRLISYEGSRGGRDNQSKVMASHQGDGGLDGRTGPGLVHSFRGDSLTSIVNWPMNVQPVFGSDYPAPLQSLCSLLDVSLLDVAEMAKASVSPPVQDF